MAHTRVPRASCRHMGGTGTGHVTVMSRWLSCGATAGLRAVGGTVME